MVLGPAAGAAFAEKAGIAAYFVERGDEGRLTDRVTPAFAAFATV